MNRGSKVLSFFRGGGGGVSGGGGGGGGMVELQRERSPNRSKFDTSAAVKYIPKLDRDSVEELGEK